MLPLIIWLLLVYLPYVVRKNRIIIVFHELLVQRLWMIQLIWRKKMLVQAVDFSKYEKLAMSKSEIAKSIFAHGRWSSSRYYTFFDQCKNPKACTIILRGANKDVLNEIERNFQDAMSVTRNVMLEPRLTPGGGAVEMALSRFVCSHVWSHSCFTPFF